MLARTLNTVCPVCKLCFSVMIITTNRRKEKEELLLTLLKHSEQKHNIKLKKSRMSKTIKQYNIKLDLETVKELMRS